MGVLWNLYVMDLLLAFSSLFEVLACQVIALNQLRIKSSTSVGMSELFGCNCGNCTSTGIVVSRASGNLVWTQWVGVGGFTKVVATGPLIYYGPHWGYLNNTIFSNLGLFAAYWACFMCHHELWPTSVSHRFPLNSFLGFAGGKPFQEINIPILRIEYMYCSSKFCYSRLLS